NFNLQVDTNHQWPTTVSPPNTGDMQPDASVLVTIVVNVPAGSALGDVDSAVIEAIGQEPQPGSYFGETTITTYAGRWQRRNLLPTGRSRGAAVTFAPNGRIYAIGGEYNNGDTDLPILEYDPIA